MVELTGGLYLISIGYAVRLENEGYRKYYLQDSLQADFMKAIFSEGCNKY